MKITFLGGVQEVTGSRTLVEDASSCVLVDCGLFQEGGDRKNRGRFPVDPRRIDALILTHAHIDHTGYIPALVIQGFSGPIYCSAATFALCRIMLLDSAMIQEEDAKRINERRTQRQKKVEPLYTTKDVEQALQLFKPIAYDHDVPIGSLSFKLVRSGHILGSAFVELSNDTTTITFSGDLGRPNQTVIKPRPELTGTDYLVLESTYGNRLHKKGNSLDVLKSVVQQTIATRGILLIPAFAVGRTQLLLYYLFELRTQFPAIPIFLDSPMAINVTDLYCEFDAEHQLSKRTCADAFHVAKYIRKAKESEKLERLQGPAIIIAGSGMATGGRILEHLKNLIDDEKNTILFVGYQAKGTLGRKLIEGLGEVKFYGKKYPVKAHIDSIETLSAHADYDEILAWLAAFKKAPKKVFLNHGEKDAAQALKEKIEQQLGWSVVIPKYKESFTLG